MAYRLAGSAEQQIEDILFKSARRFGMTAAVRYGLLINTVMVVLGDPLLVGSDAISGARGIGIYPLRLGRDLVQPAEQRVRRPRHLVVYRLGPDRVTEILGFAHDRMLLSRAARRMTKAADGA